MKQILKSALTLILFAAALQTALAQPGRGPRQTPEQRAEQQTQEMTEQLALNEEQTEFVQAINLKYAQKMHEARANAEGYEGMRESMGKIQEEKQAELKLILSEEQLQQWQTYQQEKWQGRKGPRGKGGRKGKPEKAAPADQQPQGDQ
ncbi:MAG: hypothetical protein KDC30_20240 [Saprospiraceae bacterium]|nr:hypothetical protein [Saprospiraceae bacterium]